MTTVTSDDIMQVITYPTFRKTGAYFFSKASTPASAGCSCTPFVVAVQAVDLYFTANETPEDKKVPVFLNTIGRKTYTLLRDLVDPDLPSTKLLEQLKQCLKSHFEPKVIVVAERFYFHQRNQGPTETITDYVAELRRLAKSCQFSKFLNESLRDRFVCGLHNTAIQKRLLTESDLKLSQAIQIVQSLEASDLSAKKLHRSDEGTVHRTAHRTG